MMVHFNKSIKQYLHFLNILKIFNHNYLVNIKLFLYSYFFHFNKILNKTLLIIFLTLNLYIISNLYTK